MQEEDLEFFSDVVRKRRRELGWSQNRLARESSMESSTISRIENNVILTPQPDKVRRLAKALSLSQIELMKLAGHVTDDGYPADTWRDRLRDELGLSEEALAEIARTIERDSSRQRRSKEPKKGGSDETTN